MRPRITKRVLDGFFEIDRILKKAAVPLPDPRVADEIATARKYMSDLTDWWGGARVPCPQKEGKE